MEKQRRLRTWLFNLVDSGKVDNLEWLNEEKSLFKIPWKHESRNDWLPSHAQVFTEWARFTGKFREGIDKPDYKMFKTRLRCAFNKAPDIEEETEMRKYKGPSPYRVYRLLPCDKKSVKKPSPFDGSSCVVPPLTATQPPLTVEQMQTGEASSTKTTRSALAEKIKNRMDLLQAVEYERQLNLEEDITDDNMMEQKGWAKENHDLKHPVEEMERSEVVSCQIPSEMMEKYSQPPTKEATDQSSSQFYKPNGMQMCEAPSSTEAVLPNGKEENMKTDEPTGEQQNSPQSLILLQSTRYRCSLLKNMYELQKNGFLCDLLLRASAGQVVPVHANVLCGSSGFFKEKVDHWDIGHSGDTAGGCMVLDFEDVSLEILNNIVQFIYMGEFEVGRENLPHILAASKRMQLDDLTILCEHVLKALRGSLIDEKTRKPVLPKQSPLMATSGKPQATTKPQNLSAAPIPAFLCEKEPNTPIVIRPQISALTKQQMTSPHPNPLRRPSLDLPVTPTSFSHVQTSPPTPGRQSFSGWHIPHQGQPDQFLKSNSDATREHTPAINQGPRSLPSNYFTESHGGGSNRPQIRGRDGGSQLMERGLVSQLPNRFSSGPQGTADYPSFQPITPAPPASFVPVTSAMCNPLHVLCQAVDETIRSESQSDEDLTVDLDKVVSPGEEKMPAKDSFEHASTKQQTQEAVIHTQQVQKPQQPKQLVQAIPPVVLLPPPDIHKHGHQQSPVTPQPQMVLPSGEVGGPDGYRGGVLTIAIQPPTSTQSGVNTPAKADDELYKCKYCSKMFQQPISRSTHQLHCRSNTTLSAERKPWQKQQFSVSDETIQEIVQRIKEKAGGPEGQLPQAVAAPVMRVAGQALVGRPRGTRNKARRYHSSQRGAYRQKEVIVIEEDGKKVANGSTGADQIIDKDKSLAVPQPKRLKTSNDSVTSLTGSSKKNVKDSEKTHTVNVTCQECGLSMTSVDEVQQHKNHCEGNLPQNFNHICDQCGKMFAEEEKLEAHIHRHEKLRSLTCTQCKKVCKSALLLKLHFEGHASHRMKFSCMDCGKCFMTKTRLERHIQVHLRRGGGGGAKGPQYECDLCKQTFTNKSMLSQHISSHIQQQLKEEQTNMITEEAHDEDAGLMKADNPEDNLTTAKIPQKSEIYKPLTVKVDEHVLKQSPNEPVIPLTSMSHDLGNEARHEHNKLLSSPSDTGLRGTGEMSKKCLICGEMFGDHVKKMVHLMGHFQFHADPSKVVCQVCQSTLDKESIPAHEMSHAKEAPLQCPHCDGAFSNSAELNSHVNEDHMEQACEKCTEVFTSREELTEHSVVHQGASKSKEPLVCEVCHRVFSSKYAPYEYKRHMYSHTGEKPIACRYCEKGFKDYSGRSQHEKRVHNRGPLSRGRTKGSRPAARNTFVETVQPQPNQVLPNTRPRHGPPPLVNIDMLSDEVKNNFFPALRSADSQRTSFDGSEGSRHSDSVKEAISSHNTGTINLVQPGGVGGTERREGGLMGDSVSSEEEDLSIMVALKGDRDRQTEQPFYKNMSYASAAPSYIPRNHLPIATVPSYRPLALLKTQPAPLRLPHPTHYRPVSCLMNPGASSRQEMQSQAISSGLLLQTSVGPRGNMQYSLHPAASSPSVAPPPVELLSHLTTSKGNPVISPSGKSISVHAGSMETSSSHGLVVMSMSGPQRPPTTGLARVGNQLKMSNMVAPTLRRQPSPVRDAVSGDEGEEDEKDAAATEKPGMAGTDQFTNQTKTSSFYPNLPKKRPYVPQANGGMNDIKAQALGQ